MTRERDFLLDNVKAVLIILVVIGHFMEVYVGKSMYVKAMFISIYSFHMPLFVFISGYLSQSANSNKLRKMLGTLLVPYLLFGSLWYLRQSLHVTPPYYFDVLSPPFHLWYLLALFIWRLLMPVFKVFKHYILWSVVVSLLVGLSAEVDNTLALARSLSLFPFFLLGNYYTRDRLRVILQYKSIALIGIILLALLAGYVYLYNPTHLGLFFWAQPYHVAGYSNLLGIALRLGAIILAAVLGLSLMVLLPHRKTYISFIGERTITIYLFHGFFVHPFAARFPTLNTDLFHNLIIVLFPFVLILVLSWSVIDQLYHRFLRWLDEVLFVPRRHGSGITNPPNLAQKLVGQKKW